MLGPIVLAALLLAEPSAKKKAKVNHAAKAQEALTNVEDYTAMQVRLLRLGTANEDVRKNLFKARLEFAEHCQKSGRDALTCSTMLAKAEERGRSAARSAH